MKLIVGLGNIGEKYEKSVHNVGFMVVDKLADHLGFTFKNRGCDSDYAEFRTHADKFVIAKPRTYMNESGKAVKSLMNKFKIDIHDVIVVNDDIDLKPSFVRIRKSGSAGTHNGLKSVIAETKSTEFNRIRVGVGGPEEHQDLADFVLSRMKRTDEQMQGIEKAFLALCDIMRGESVDDAMTKYNGESNKNGKH